ncbi:putative cold-shock DNA-binding protein [Sphaerotilus hippei]|uniref:Putative cold-shock DNA-binding protein n=1 Tax=Sphaerotilus hippei TaxID=744406 RepID=A0A318H3D2_9BURK|nr:cold shock domain-containing protein [Sphaerotilus hippei]PXW98065.1 putative cold-shock DNA-binding protein [Sphaerotilus hippei]
MHQGNVKWFSDQKGFGFIEADGITGDVFAHFSAIVKDGYRSLKEGARVEFELIQGEKGYSAQNIVALASAGSSTGGEDGGATAGP